MSVAGLSRKVTPKMNLVIRLQLTFVACLVSFSLALKQQNVQMYSGSWLMTCPRISPVMARQLFRHRMLIAWQLRAYGSRVRMPPRLYARPFGLP